TTVITSFTPLIYCHFYKEETNSVRAAQRHLFYLYLQENGCTGVAVAAGSIDRTFTAASMPGTLCAIQRTSYVKESFSIFLSSVFQHMLVLFGRLLFSRLPKMFPGANVKRSHTKTPRSHSHRSIPVGRETLENDVAIDCQHALFAVTQSWKRLTQQLQLGTKLNTEHAINDTADGNGTISKAARHLRVATFNVCAWENVRQPGDQQSTE
ncbi:hypothetical protein M513_11970, partial [Trichuris suis]